MVELTLLAPEAVVEPVSEALLERGAQSVSVEDADAGSDAERSLFAEPGSPAPSAWQRSTLSALFADEPAALDAATWLLAQSFAADCSVRALRAVDDRDWVRLTQSQFAPVAVNERFWIVPSWHEPPAHAATVIRLDPGLAFGTGTHATTRMCLRWIAAHPQPWPRVLDYGCGSGILAIGASLHGAREVDAVDIDPAAIEATRANAAANGVALRVGAPEAAEGRYALVLANILAAPLKLLAPVLSAHVEPGGDLLLAGLLSSQVAQMQAAYAPWLALDVADSDDGWALLHGRVGR